MRAVLRKSKRAIAVIITVVAILGSLVVIAHIPRAKPTQLAISNVESNPRFTSIVTASGTHAYEGFTNNPRTQDTCVRSTLFGIATFFSPFHEYGTTTLIFSARPKTSKYVTGQIADFVGLLLVRVNPSNGQIQSLKLEPICA